MPAASATLARSFELDRENFTIRLERLLDASATAAFDAWTRPDELSQWWDPEGKPLLRCEIDLRVGGRFVFVPQGHPDMPFAGSYREIERPRRLVFVGSGAIGTLTFDSEGGKTRLTLTIRCASAEHFEQFVAMRIAEGTAQTLDNLVAFAGQKD